jgi:hypothetical protein
MKKIFLCCALLAGLQTLHAQSKQWKAMNDFVEKKADGFNVAYEKKDAKAYQALTDEFLALYNPLSDKEKPEFKGTLSGIYYNFCCVHALLNHKAEAIECLKKAVNHGYNDYNHVQEDTDLDNIRKEKDYQDVNALLKNIGDMRYILKRGRAYNSSDARPLPAFSYQKSDDPNLVELRKKYNLDSIAGKDAPEVLKVLNLMRWVHNLIPHDGMHGLPDERNALNMVAECTNQKKGLNCRGLALLLNECYLAVGIKSRIVTCQPKDSLKVDFDCHVINAVYSVTLKKWLWIDPTFNAFVMDESGQLLSVEEVRDRLINDKPLILNPDANWNNKTQQSKGQYLDFYMAKNLYILECPANSAFNMETPEQGKTYASIQLLPLDFFSQSPDKEEVKRSNNNGIVTTFKTNNANKFWEHEF